MTRKNHMDVHIASRHQPMLETVVDTQIMKPVDMGGAVWEQVETHTEVKMVWGHRWEDGVSIVTEGVGREKGSLGERLIAGILRDRGVGFVTKKSFDDLRGVSGGPLRFGIAIKDGSRYFLIEYDGPHHSEPVCFDDMSYYEAVRAFDRTVEHDRRKDEYCRANGHLLLRISYRESDQARYLVSSFIADHLSGGSDSSNWRTTPSPVVSE